MNSKKKGDETNPKMSKKTLFKQNEELDPENKEIENGVIKYKEELELSIASMMDKNQKLLKSYTNRCAVLEKIKENVRNIDIEIKENNSKINELKSKNNFLNKFVVEKNPNQTILQMKKTSKKYKEETNNISTQVQQVLDESLDHGELQNVLNEKISKDRELMDVNKKLRKERDKALMDLIELDKLNGKSLRPLIKILVQRVKENNRIIKAINFTNENILRKNEGDTGKDYFPAESESVQFFELLDLLNENDFEDKSLSTFALGYSLYSTEKSINQEDQSTQIGREEGSKLSIGNSRIIANEEEMEELERKRKEEEIRKKNLIRRRLRKEIEEGCSLEGVHLSMEMKDCEVMTDESSLQNLQNKKFKQEKFDLINTKRDSTEITKLQNDIIEIDKEVTTMNANKKKEEEKRMERISKLQFQLDFEHVGLDPQQKHFNTKDVETATDQITDLSELKAEISENEAKTTETFKKEQQVLEIKEKESKLAVELNLLRLENERKTSDLHSYIERLKHVNSVDFATAPNIAHEIRSSSADKDKVLRRRERLTKVDQIIMERESEMQMLESRVADLQTINNSLNKEIKSKANEPKKDIKEMCDTLKSYRKQIMNCSRHYEFVKMENEALQEEIIRINAKYSDKKERELTEKTKKLAESLAKQKQKFYAIKGVSKSAVPLSCEEELIWIQKKTKEINDAISVIKMKVGSVASKIEKQQKMCKELDILVPEPPMQLNEFLKQRY